MANQTSFKVTAKDRTRRAFASVRSGLIGLGRASSRVFGSIAKVGLAAGAAIVAFGVRAVQAYSKQQNAERSLAAALSAHGDEVEKLLPLLKAQAAAIQDETAAGDEETLSLMARLRMLGVYAGSLDKAAKATMALTSVGVRQNTAMRAVAAAMQGNYTLLQSYVPALRKAKSETEKANIVNALFARGYKQQKDLLNTLTGSWKSLTGRIGDALEPIGQMISEAFDLSGLFNRLADRVKTFGENLRKYLNSEEFKKTRQVIQGLLKDLSESGDQRSQALERIGELLKAHFMRAGEIVVDIIKRAAPLIGKLAGAAAKAAVDAIMPGDPYVKEAKRRLRAGPDFPARTRLTREQSNRLNLAAEKLAQKLREEAMYERMGIEPPKQLAEGEEPELTPAQVLIQKLNRKLAKSYEDIVLPDVKPPTGGGIVVGDDDDDSGGRQGLSQFAQNVMSRLRARGHTVEQFGAMPEIEQAMREKRADMRQDQMAKDIHDGVRVAKETRDLLRENLEQK